MSTEAPSRRIRNLMMFAFAAMVVVLYADLAQRDHPTGTVGGTIICFVAGALYTLVALAAQRCGDDRRPLARAGYYVVQYLLVATAILFAPQRGGSFELLTLPLVAQAVMELGVRMSATVSLALFALCASSIAWKWGSWNALRGAVSYLPAFLFTVVVALFAKHAIAARNEAEKLSAKLADANDRLRAQAEQAGELATAHERNRVAREIHDGVGHYLTVIKVQLDAARATFDAQPATARHSVDTAARVAREALDDVRRSVGSLRADATRPPLPEALRALAANAEPPTEVLIAGEPRRLEPAVEHALFRAAQEGLTNIRKHAHASSATVTLDFRARARVRLEIADNGEGAQAAASQARATPSFGIAGLRERVALLGGTLSAAPRDGRGWLLVVEVPA
jgi:signal transduction histidine kinase